MFTIEYVVMRNARPFVTDRTAAMTTLLEEAESTAEVAISSLRQNRPEAGPHVYQIRDERDEIVFQSWEMAT
jgi:hypothetical protein